MAELAVSEVWPWARSFAVLLTLSVMVAVMGLSADSAAVVIGAMLIAPLMGPVLAVAASLAMTLRRHTVVSLVKVVAATVWSVVLAYALSRALPGTALSAEALARTQPDVRDLLVALAAGAAGAYATVRRDVSAALPGVAVAVALVPPLATVGISLEAGKADLVAGAFLLYITNLAAIVFAGVMVFVATGFVPARRITNRGLQLLA
ncbi:MAG: TIGR00341 family protein, partial [Acidimicrobiia bacterium]|nr:TIGR00341 family protein [Acidimicrobiia bacterium]